LQSIPVTDQLSNFNFNSIPKNPYAGVHPLDIETAKINKYINKSVPCNRRASPKDKTVKNN
jgi:hypothetical protein